MKFHLSKRDICKILCGLSSSSDKFTSWIIDVFKKLTFASYPNHVIKITFIFYEELLNAIEVSDTIHTHQKLSMLVNYVTQPKVSPLTKRFDKIHHIYERITKLL